MCRMADGLWFGSHSARSVGHGRVGEIPSLAKVLKWAWEHYTRMEGHSCPHAWVAKTEWRTE